MTKHHRPSLLAAVVILAISQVAGAKESDDGKRRADWIRANYTKFEYRIPMRDGARLFTAVYVPNDSSSTHPFLLFRTPYAVGPYGADRYAEKLGPTKEFEKDGFIFVFQDVRGRFMSEGEFVNMRPHIRGKRGAQVDESSDTHDTITWLLKHVARHNGKAGQWGISYPGFYTSAGAIDSHPALRAVSPQAPIADWFWDDMHHNGAFTLTMAFNFFSRFGVERPIPTTTWPDRFEHGTPDGYQFFLDIGPLKNVNTRHFHQEIDFWNRVVAHPNYDEFWKSRNILPHLHNIKAAVLVVGGWFDTEDLYGPLKTYESIRRKNPDTSCSLVMGPWTHGQWNSNEGRRVGNVDWGFATSQRFRDKIQLAFFKHYLKDGDAPNIATATVFETGSNRWREFDAWPPKKRKIKPLYLNGQGQVSFELPSDSDRPFDDYVSDPSKPVPYTTEITPNWTTNYMTGDQRFASWRPDVLVYRSDTLQDDLTLIGPMQADLWVSTSGDDADWIVKLIDEHPGKLPGISRRDREQTEIDAYPGGRQMLVRAEAFRGRFRESFTHPKPFTPNKITSVQFELPDVFHTFKRGHRLMIHIQSTWFPFIDRNPQSWVDNIFEASSDDFVRATNRVYHTPKHPSCLRVGVLNK